MADRRGRARPSRVAIWIAAVATIALSVGPVGAAGAQDGVTIDGEACTDGVGVTVVVDFQELGDDTVVVRCAADAPTDGFAALDAAGVPYRTTVTFPGFLCRLFDEPSTDPCDTTSPADAYWSYWLAPAGGEWCYSNKGAGNRTPPPGSVEGWSFSLDRTSEDVPPPRFAPPGAPEGGEATPLAESDCGVGVTPGTGQTPDDVATGGTDGAEGTTVGDGTDPGRAVGRGGPVDLDAGGDDGSPVATIVGLLAVAALATAAVVVALRRRRAGITAASAGTAPTTAPSPDVWRRPDGARPASSEATGPSGGAGPGRDEPLPDVTMWARPDDGGDATLDR